MSRPGVKLRYYDAWDGETREAWTDGKTFTLGRVVPGDDGKLSDEIEEECSMSLPGRVRTRAELRGLLLEKIGFIREDRENDGAFYDIFEDHHRGWTHYRGDCTDAKAMHAFLDDIADLIRRAKLAVDRQAEEPKATAERTKSKLVSLPRESGQ